MGHECECMLFIKTMLLVSPFQPFLNFDGLFHSCSLLIAYVSDQFCLHTCSYFCSWELVSSAFWSQNFDTVA